jgi:FMN-dependent NADH-azoreductase
MKKLLVIDASPKGPASASRKISHHIVKKIQSLHPQVEVIHHDLTKHPIPHLNPETVNAFFTPEAQLSGEQKKLITLSNQLTQELIGADAIVVSSPMWNFSVPSVLKAWIDHVVRSGLTFRYTDKGPEGLLSPSKKLILALSSGGVYSSGPAQSVDHLSTYLKDIFGFLGVRDVQSFVAEGTAYPNNEAPSVEKAIAAVSALKL